jgi:hypothetical protein
MPRLDDADVAVATCTGAGCDESGADRAALAGIEGPEPPYGPAVSRSGGARAGARKRKARRARKVVRQLDVLGGDGLHGRGKLERPRRPRGPET